MTIRSLNNSGRLPHAILLVGGNSVQVDEVIAMHKCDKSDTVYVRDIMPPSDTEKKKSAPPYSYKIEALRDIVAMGNMRPQFGDTRVFVFTDFNSASVPCQNALLKFFEEPPPYNRFVLTADNTSKILPTILSRVVVIRDNGNADETVSDAATDEIVAAIMTAVKVRNKPQSEYDTAAAFAQIKDRPVLTAVLKRLSEELGGLMATAKKPDKLIAATDVLQKYIRRTDVNPNVGITVSACAAELHTALH
jgi:DNA polymerase III delta prime subunit